MGSKVKVTFGTLCMSHCWRGTEFSFCSIAFKLHKQVVDDKWKNPIDFGVTGSKVNANFGNCMSSIFGLITFKLVV